MERSGRVFRCVMIYILMVGVSCNLISQVPNTRGSTGQKSSQREKRQCSLNPFNVECHGYCPKRSTRDWEKLVRYWNCSAKFEGTTYHCAKNSSGEFVEGCAEPKRCNKGMEPIIRFPLGHTELAEVDCKRCKENRYNPFEGKMSDTFSECPEVRRKCRSSEGQIECDIVTGVERTWNDSKCMCNIRENYIPLSGERITCTDDYLLRCYSKSPCQDSSDGQKQEYLLSNFSCAPVCGDGYYPRNHTSDDCIQERNYTNRNISTTEDTTAVTTNKTTTTELVIVIDVTTNDAVIQTKGKESNELTTTGMVLISIGSVVGIIVIYFAIGLVFFLRKFKRDKEKGRCTKLYVIWYWPCKLRQCSKTGKFRKGPPRNRYELERLSPQQVNMGIPSQTPDNNDLTDERASTSGASNSETDTANPESQVTVRIPNQNPDIEGLSDEPASTSGASNNETDTANPDSQVTIEGLSDELASTSGASNNETNTANPESQVTVRIPNQNPDIEGLSDEPASTSGASNNETDTANPDGQVTIEGLSDELASTSGASNNETNTANPESQEWIGGLPEEIRKRVLTDMDLTQLPEFIGGNWEQVAFNMGLSKVAVEHIGNDNPKLYTKIHAVIYKWRESVSSLATIENFLKILRKSSSATIEWNLLKRFIENIMKCNDDETSSST